MYRIAGKFGEFGKSQAFCQTKIIYTLHYVIIIINSCHSPDIPLPNLLRTEFAKLSCYVVNTGTYIVASLGKSPSMILKSVYICV